MRVPKSLTIPQVCANASAKHKVRQEKTRIWAGTKWKNGDFVFTSDIGTPLHPDDVSRFLPKILEDAKLPKVRFHDLRHSCASLLLSLGVPDGAGPGDIGTLELLANDGHLLRHDPGAMKLRIVWMKFSQLLSAKLSKPRTPVN